MTKWRPFKMGVASLVSCNGTMPNHSVNSWMDQSNRSSTFRKKWFGDVSCSIIVRYRSLILLVVTIFENLHLQIEFDQPDFVTIDTFITYFLGRLVCLLINLCQIQKVIDFCSASWESVWETRSGLYEGCHRHRSVLVGRGVLVWYLLCPPPSLIQWTSYSLWG